MQLEDADDTNAADETSSLDISHRLPVLPVGCKAKGPDPVYPVRAFLFWSVVRGPLRLNDVPWRQFAREVRTDMAKALIVASASGEMSASANGAEHVKAETEISGAAEPATRIESSKTQGDL